MEQVCWPVRVEARQTGISMLSLAYVSRPTSWQKSRAETFADIQMVSIARNTSLDITGVLITTSSYITQVLEGPHCSVEAVMTSIMVDPRHQDITIVRRSSTRHRCFPLWRMLQFDNANFADTALVPILEALHAEQSGEALLRFDNFTNALGRTHASGRPDHPYHQA